MAIRSGTFRLHPALTDVLNAVDGTPIGTAFKDRAIDLVNTTFFEEPIDKAEALRAHHWLIDRAGADGLPLTAAGYLKPADAQAFADVVPTMREWPFGFTRESDARPLLWFRQHLVSAGLFRKYRGTLQPTKVARAGLADPDGLWAALAARLIPSRHRFDEAASVVIAVHAATNGGGAMDTDAVARTLSAAGWKHDDRDGVSARDVHPLWNDLWAGLGNVGAPTETRVPFERSLSPAAIALVRDALFVEVPAEGG